VAPDRIISTVDPEARHMHKSRSEYRDGYKAHIAIEPETGLVTAGALTPANASDGSTGIELLTGEEPRTPGAWRRRLWNGPDVGRLERGPSTNGPSSLSRPTWPIKGGFHRDDFIVDEVTFGHCDVPGRSHCVTITAEQRLRSIRHPLP
jgi:hypothetical protein